MLCNVQYQKGRRMSRLQHFLIFSISWILICNTIFSRAHMYAYDSDDLRTTSYWLQKIKWNHNQPVQNSPSLLQKRDCSGFPCMYTHIAGTVGNASIKMARLTLLRECIADPNCSSIGKRSHYKYAFLNKLIRR